MNQSSLLSTSSSIYFVGIRGVGMSALAVVLSSFGKKITGVDLPTEHETQTHRLLHKYPDIHVYDGFSPDHITPGFDLIIAPAVHQGENNPEVQQARKLGLPVMYYAEALGALMDLHAHKISVCGTHGKSTTTTLVAHVMQSLRLAATHIIGASNKNMDSGHSTGREYIVVESDEYAVAAGLDHTPKFMKLHPDYILCTSLEHDHVDVYPTEESYADAFETYFSTLGPDGKLVYCCDVPLLRTVAETIPPDKRISYGLVSTADVYAKDITVTSAGTQFTCVLSETTEVQVVVPLYGDHSVSNTVGVLALSNALGWDMDMVVAAISRFPGLERRFEQVFADDHVVYIDDYAHHPAELEAVISAIQAKYPGRRILAIFQPHTYSRTQEFLDGFIKALSRVDYAFILDIYGATREKTENFTITSAQIEQKSRERGIETILYVPEDECLVRLAAYLHEGDIIVTLGAGDATYYLRDDIAELLGSHFLLR